MGCDAGQAGRSDAQQGYHPSSGRGAHCQQSRPPPEATFVLDTGLNTLWSANWIRQSGKHRIIGSFNNAAVGTALGHANGIQCARPVADKLSRSPATAV